MPSAKPKSKPKSKPLSSQARPPSTSKLRQSVRERAFRTPRGLQVDCPEVTGSIVISFPIPDVDWKQVLTPTEIEVVGEALAGLGNAEIGAKRGVASRTVANQLASIYQKLGVRSRLELSLFALAGLRTFDKRRK